MSHEQRASSRFSLISNVIVRHPSIGSIAVKSRDISDGGLSVVLGNVEFPPVGTVVDVILKKHTGRVNNTPVKMQIIHVQSNGLAGLKFI